MSVGALLLLSSPPASAGGPQEDEHFIALPYRSRFIDADEARRAAADIPDAVEAAAPSPLDARLAALDAAILADARRGTELWERSCVWQGDAGCTVIEERAWLPLREDLVFNGWGAPRRRRRIVEERDPVAVAHALQHLRRAEGAWRRRVGANNPPAPQVRRAAAWTLVLLAEHEFESLHAIEPLRGLSFDAAEWMAESGVPEWEEESKIRASIAHESRRRYVAHHERVIEAVNGLLERYREILGLHDLRSTVAVLARAASLAEEWTILVDGIRAPAVTKKRERGTSWGWECLGVLRDDTGGDPVEGVLRACVDVAEAHDFREDPFVRLCRGELARLHAPSLVEDDEVEFVGALRPPRPERVSTVDLSGEPILRAGDVGGGGVGPTRPRRSRPRSSPPAPAPPRRRAARRHGTRGPARAPRRSAGSPSDRGA